MGHDHRQDQTGKAEDVVTHGSALGEHSLTLLGWSAEEGGRRGGRRWRKDGGGGVLDERRHAME
jgi:hypothetical protein